MWRAVELSYIHCIVLVLQHRRLVVIDIKVVGSREYGYESRKAGILGFLVHAKSVVALNKDFVALKKLTQHPGLRVRALWTIGCSFRETCTWRNS